MLKLYFLISDLIKSDELLDVEVEEDFETCPDQGFHKPVMSIQKLCYLFNQNCMKQQFTTLP